MNAKMIILVLGLVVLGTSSCKKETKQEKGYTEAMTMVRLMSNNVKTYYALHKKFPQGTAVNPPLGSCCSNGGECSPGAGDQWSDNGWVDLDFAMTKPHYYSYQLVVDVDTLSYTASAYGDL